MYEKLNGRTNNKQYLIKGTSCGAKSLEAIPISHQQRGWVGGPVGSGK